MRLPYFWSLIVTGCLAGTQIVSIADGLEANPQFKAAQAAEQNGDLAAALLAYETSYDSTATDEAMRAALRARFAVLRPKVAPNTDSRQAVFHKSALGRGYGATFIDQGYCFNASDWSFPDAPLFGLYRDRAIYGDVRGFECFEPWLSQIETFDDEKLWAIASEVPEEWYESNHSALENLIGSLSRRRRKVASFIEDTQRCLKNPFPSWQLRVAAWPSNSPRVTTPEIVGRDA